HKHFFHAAIHFLLLVGAPASGNETPSATAPETASPSGTLAASSTATCPSRTINYLTHTLPQQCLRNSWTRHSAGASSSGVEAITTNTVESVFHSTTGADGTFGELAESKQATQPVAHQATEGQAEFSAISVVGESSSSDTPSSIQSQPYAASSPESALESETDSPLDNENFLSFEEWKKKNLENTGQSPDTLGQGHGTEPRRRPSNINNALDALGDDIEIDIDFGGFGGKGPGERAQDDRQRASTQNTATATPDVVPNAARPRSKDAGKTCKERFNYASIDCAATVLKTNPRCKSSSSVLVESKDSYMLNECSAPNKFIILELCDDILIDTLVLANFEFFSSMTRTFRVSVSDRYPVKLDRWKDLGTFEARNSREIQAFLIENPLIWARYLRIEFLTHYGNEYYCPTSLIRVHGTTMMEQFKQDEDAARDD
ncbi:hypothetical protein LTS18_014799, partial [Coniosporium uncinatum]